MRSKWSHYPKGQHLSPKVVRWSRDFNAGVQPSAEPPRCPSAPFSSGPEGIARGAVSCPWVPAHHSCRSVALHSERGSLTSLRKHTVLERKLLNSIISLRPWEVYTLCSSHPNTPRLCGQKTRSQFVFFWHLAVPTAPRAPTERRGALSCSAPRFTRPGREDGDRSDAPCAIQREAVRRGADFLSFAPLPLCECQRSIPLISQIDGIV